ncbi:hypothetical protein ACFWZR_24545 [Streptomyces sp. NPDC059017]|uniref:hypothetical protein n=1 Tax=Streptomyces sp. NPDC059017 TaxID=3346700 RepID=UPI0036B2CF9D
MTGPLVLIEPYADRLGGHHQRTLVALAKARPCSLVIAPHGIVREAVAALREAGARLVTAPAGHPAAVLLAASRLAAGLSRAGLRVFRSRRWPRFLRRLPHQITLIARCLAEASALRTARRLAPGAEAVVILSASEALHGASALLGGLPHLRFVHEQVTTEDAAVRFLGRLARRGERQVLAVCPTQAVGDQITAAFPDLAAVVRAFAVDDGRRLTDAERDGGRTAFDIPTSEAAVCLVGGWWPYKDIGVIDAALTLLKWRGPTRAWRWLRSALCSRTAVVAGRGADTKEVALTVLRLRAACTRLFGWAVMRHTRTCSRPGGVGRRRGR